MAPKPIGKGKGKGKKKKVTQDQQDDNPTTCGLTASGSADTDTDERSVGLDEIKLWSMGALRSFLEVRNISYKTSTPHEELAAKYL